MAAAEVVAMADGFLGRWSRRKQQAREAEPEAAPLPDAAAAAPSAVPVPTPEPLDTSPQ